MLKTSVTVILLLVLITALAIAQDGFMISGVNGQPKINRANTSEWVVCKEGMEVGQGDRIRTMVGETMEISFGAKGINRILIDESSDVFLKKSDSPYTLELLNGRTMAMLKKLPPKSAFEVRTPAGLCGARGTGILSETDGKRSVFGSFENSVYAKGIDASGNAMGGEFLIGSGFKTSVNMFEMPSGLEPLSEEDLARWNEWKNDVDVRSGGGPGGGAFGRGDAVSGAMDAQSDRIADNSDTRDVERLDERLSGKESVSSGGYKPPSNGGW